jgi:hypothetical protein
MILRATRRRTGSDCSASHTVPKPPFADDFDQRVRADAPASGFPGVKDRGFRREGQGIAREVKQAIDTFAWSRPTDRKADCRRFHTPLQHSRQEWYRVCISRAKRQVSESHPATYQRSAANGLQGICAVDRTDVVIARDVAVREIGTAFPAQRARHPLWMAFRDGYGSIRDRSPIMGLPARLQSPVQSRSPSEDAEVRPARRPGPRLSFESPRAPIPRSELDSGVWRP